MLVDLFEETLKKAVQELKSEQVKYCFADGSKAIDLVQYLIETVSQYVKNRCILQKCSY